MKLSTFGVIAAAGMAATSVAVWIASGSGGVTESRAGVAPVPPPEDPEPAPTPVERPEFQAAGTLAVEGRLGHAVIPATTDSETYLYLDVKADPDAVATQATPLNVSIVIDRSGSMKGERIRHALSAARTMVERMREGDAVSVVAYNTRTQVLVPTTVIDDSTRARVLSKLRSLRVTGDTCISCGIEAGMRLVGQTPGMIGRILLLSDGKATAGLRAVEQFGRIADRCRQMNVSISSIGAGIDYNEQLMAIVARRSNGRHYFVADAAGLPQVFDREMASLTATIASGAEIAIDLGPGVFLDRVFDRSFRRIGSRVVVPLGTFASADSKTVLVRLRVPRGADGARPIADVRLSYSDLVTGRQGEADGRLIARATTDLTEVSRLDGMVSARLSRSEIASLLETANVLSRSGRISEAQGLIRSKRDALKKRRRAARKSAPRARGVDLDADFAAQAGALAAADEGLSSVDSPFAGAAASGPAPTATPAKAPRPAVRREVQIRANQQAAFDLAE